MRQWFLPLLILSVAACSQEGTPRAASSAAPPPPSAPAAQSSPAAAAAAGVMGVPAAKPVLGATTPVPVDVAATALKAPRNDPRWRDVDPAELAKDDAPAKDTALDSFQQEQKRRDAELMAKDAEEAERYRDGRADDGAPRDDDRYAQRDDPYARGEDRYAREGDRYRDDPRLAARRASRERERAYGDDRYAQDDSYARGDRYERQDQYPPQDEYDPYDDAPPQDDYEYPLEDEGYYADPYQR
jgi:hypothetical protein